MEKQVAEDDNDEVNKDKKLRAETIELLNKFFKTLSATKTAVTPEERKVISSAYVKMSAIRRLIRRNPPPAVADIRECRSKIERQISGICNKLSNLTLKDSYRRHRHHLKSSSTTFQIYHQLKRKASMQQGTRKQNSVKAQQLQQEASITQEHYLEKLILEDNDYDETARFIETSLRMHTTKEDREVLSEAYENFARVYRKQHNIIRSIRQGGTEIIDHHMIDNNRSKIVKELSNVCAKLSNVTIKEAYLHHLDEFNTHAKPKSILRALSIRKRAQKSSSREGQILESPNHRNHITKKPHIHEDLEEDDFEDDFQDHNKCNEEELERFGRIGNWDPNYEGLGADLLHAPVNHSVHSVKEGNRSNYHMMRGACKPRETFTKYRTDYFDLFDGFYEGKMVVAGEAEHA